MRAFYLNDADGNTLGVGGVVCGAVGGAVRPCNRPQRVLDILSGPAATSWETMLTMVAMLGACAVAYDEAAAVRTNWTSAQCVVAGVFAVMDGAAAVQCCTAQSKRWYAYLKIHAGECGRGR